MTAMLRPVELDYDKRFWRQLGMAYTYEELKGKTITELREIAHNLPAPGVQGYSQLNKDHLLPALCKVLGIEAHEHHAVTGIDKAAIKARMRGLKKERAAALDAHDHAKLHSVRRQIHGLNHQLRSHAR
jgi:hypothetical protein